MKTEPLHIGFGGVIAANRILPVGSPDPAPIRRLIRQAKEKGLAIDMTCGRKTKAAIFLESGHIALVALQPETIVGRLRQQRERLRP